MSKNKIHRQKEREIQAKRRYVLCLKNNNKQKYNKTHTLTKGYKDNLYSDCLRATALYTIYRNSLNLGYPKGQCEYGHYTLIFDSIGSIFSPFFAQNRATRYCLLIRVRRFSNFYLHQHNAWGNYRSWVPYSSRVWHRVQ